MNKIKIPELDIEVEDINDFNDRAEEILTEFCEDLQSKGFTEEYTKEDIADSLRLREEGITFRWIKESPVLIEAEIKRLESIAVKYFGLTLEIDIKSHMYITD
jgi:hypothetical protein